MVRVGVFSRKSNDRFNQSGLNKGNIMGAVSPKPPRARCFATPEGTPPRQIRMDKTALALLCPVRVTRSGENSPGFNRFSFG